MTQFIVNVCILAILGGFAILATIMGIIRDNEILLFQGALYLVGWFICLTIINNTKGAL